MSYNCLFSRYGQFFQNSLSATYHHSAINVKLAAKWAINDNIHWKVSHAYMNWSSIVLAHALSSQVSNDYCCKWDVYPSGIEQGEKVVRCSRIP